MTERESEVLLAIARGLSNAEIAAELALQESTVKSHIRRMMLKLDITNRAQAVFFAYDGPRQRLRLITGPPLRSCAQPWGASNGLVAGVLY